MTGSRPIDVKRRPDVVPPPGDGRTAHIDTFVLDNLPPRDLWPVIDYSNMPEGISYGDRLNCAQELIGGAIARGFGGRPALHFGEGVWTYAELSERVDRIARFLTEQCGLVPGNRVLLRGPNTPMLVACWFAVAKAGGICVATMPLLRHGEIGSIVEKVRARFALCDVTVAGEMHLAAADSDWLERVWCFSGDGAGNHGEADLDRAIARMPGGFEAVDTAADDPLFVAFTSGTTGEPKGAVHFHRDALAITDCFPRDVWRIGPDHVFSGTPPIAFTYGLGALALIPFRFGASSVLISNPTPEALLDAIAGREVTDLYTAPTMYRRMLPVLKDHDTSSLKRCNSAGEHLSNDTLSQWKQATGLVIVDQIGTTEMLHNFMAAPPSEGFTGTAGRPVRGYTAKLIDHDDAPVAPGETGRLAVRGPVGCRYLANEERQRDYVRDGWNVTGDLFYRDDSGRYCYVGRADDLIVSSGYNIPGLEVEQALLKHGRVADCAVVGMPDPDRGQIVTAFVVPDGGVSDPGALAAELQDFVKASIAPYKYPRMVEFIGELPRTPTGKIQRFKLRRRGGRQAPTPEAPDPGPNNGQDWEPRTMTEILELTVNGRARADAVAGNVLLVDYLREIVGLTGTKMGCDGGECGACTVLVDGEPRLSCVTLAQSCAGRDVETVEGLTRNGRPGAVQR
ncbi:MAG: AMP-binding protein, partial [Hyphomicrobiales bacterium]